MGFVGKMIVYNILFESDQNSPTKWDICIKLDTKTNTHGFYYREYNIEFESVCVFKEI